MSSTFTPNLGLENPTPSDPATNNVWGGTENTGRTLTDSAVAGILSLSVAGNSNVVLSSSQGAADQSRNAHFIFTGALTGNINVLWPNGKTRVFSVFNNTTGAFTLSVGVNNGSGSPAGTTIGIPQGSAYEVVSDGTNCSQRLTAIVPTGTVAMYITTTAPTGWLNCDGTAVSRSTYAGLFTIIGTTYGAGDGSTTFNVPDMRGRVPAGYDSGNTSGRLTVAATGGASAAALNNSGGEQAHTLATTELAAHSHSVPDPGHSHGMVSGNGVVSSPGVNLLGTGGAVSISTDTVATVQTGITSTTNTGGGNSHNNVQPTLIVNYIIKT